jgi:hypothetical protein
MLPLANNLAMPISQLDDTNKQRNPIFNFISKGQLTPGRQHLRPENMSKNFIYIKYVGISGCTLTA